MNSDLKPPGWVFWPLWGLDLAVAFGFLYFFAIGILDGSIWSFNMVLWLSILATLASILVASAVLRRKDHGILAMCVACLLAIPAICALVLLLVVLVSNPDWT